MIGHGDENERILKGGHGVPLSGESADVCRVTLGADVDRLHECPVLCPDNARDPASGVQGRA
jgi:hypothetical protein